MNVINESKGGSSRATGFASRARLVSAAAIMAGIFLAPFAIGFDSGTPSDISPSSALQRLQVGNARFLCGKVDRPHCDTERRQDTFRNGQKPFAIVLSCADSRVPVEVIFDQGIGDVFTIRVAGNIAENTQIGSIEYAVAHLKAPLVVVMGHRGCGAVAAVANGAEVHGHVASIVERIAPAVEAARSACGDCKGDAFLGECVKQNVWQAVDDLLSKSEIIRDAVKKGDVRVVGAVYDIESGSVQWLGGHPMESKLLNDPGNSESHEAGHAHGNDDHGDHKSAGHGHDAAGASKPRVNGPISAKSGQKKAPAPNDPH
jgi:carbonic anhydrase